MYTYNEVYQAALNYFSGNELATSVWISKYAVQTSPGVFLEKTPEDMHRRMAKEFARIEQKYPNPRSEEEIFQAFKNFSEIIPQGSVMSILGHPTIKGSLSNCVVVPPPYDSYGGILYTDQQLTQLMKRRCGVGTDLSTLRPVDATVTNAAKTSTGVPSFMERYSNTTREVAQNARRGALMLTLDIKHPDAESFTTIKKDLTKVTGANVSLRISDEFMRAVKTDDYYIQSFPIDFDTSKINPTDFELNKLTTLKNNSVYIKVIKAKQLWNTILESAHASAEPGLIFWDRQHVYSPSSIYPKHKNISTNPCSEIAMANDSCRLISLNLMGFVENPYTPQARFNYNKWKHSVKLAMRLMDDLVDLELEKVEEIIQKIKSDPEPDYIKSVELSTWENLKQMGLSGRRTGLGITGLGDMLASLNIKYGAEECFSVVEKVGKTKLEAELESMIEMAEERGAFPDFYAKLEAEWAENPNSYMFMLKSTFPDLWDKMQKVGRRNISWSTIAPTGSVSMLGKCVNGFGLTSGLEPMFNTAPLECWYIRRKKINPNDQNTKVDFIDDLGDKWQHFKVFHEGFKQWAVINGITLEQLQNMELEELKNLVEKSPYGKSGSSEISWTNRVKLQGILQNVISHSISSTINLPNKATLEDVSNIYFLSWKTGLKGITIYRDGSRTGVLVSETSKTEKTKIQENFTENHAPKRPKEIPCVIQKFHNKGEAWLAFIGLFDGKPYEIFTGLAENFKIPNKVNSGVIRKVKTELGKEYQFIWFKDGVEINEGNLATKFNPEFWDFGKLISMLLRHGAPLQYLVQVLDNLTFGSEGISTWKKGVIRALKKFISNGTPNETRACEDETKKCQLVYQDGCVTCKECGLSKCG